MRDPIILHDHILSYTNFGDLFGLAEEGILAPDSQEAADCFTIPGKGYARSIHLLWRLLLGYRKFGQQTFVVGPRLREMLENTSLAGAPREVIRFPFEFFYIALPESGLRLWGGESGWHELTGVVVGKATNKDDFMLYAWAAENEQARYKGDDASFWVHFNLDEANTLGLDLEAYIDTIVKDPSRQDRNVNGYEPDPDTFDASEASRTRAVFSDAEIHAETRRTVRALVRIVFNLSLYLVHDGVEKSEHPMVAAARPERKRILDEIARKKNPNDKKVRRLKKELEKHTAAKVTWLGRTIEEAAERASSTSSQASPEVRIWVRGHWWPRLNNREALARNKLRWVRPYEKNKDAETTLPARHYRSVLDKEAP